MSERLHCLTACVDTAFGSEGRLNGEVFELIGAFTFGVFFGVFVGLRRGRFSGGVVKGL